MHAQHYDLHVGRSCRLSCWCCFQIYQAHLISIKQVVPGLDRLANLSSSPATIPIQHNQHLNNSTWFPVGTMLTATYLCEWQLIWRQTVSRLESCRHNVSPSRLIWNRHSSVCSWRIKLSVIQTNRIESTLSLMPISIDSLSYAMIVVGADIVENARYLLTGSRYPSCHLAHVINEAIQLV